MAIAKSVSSGLSVDNIEKAKQFYEQVLEFTLTDDSMGLQWQLPGGGQLFMYEKEGHIPAEYTALNLIVDDIDTVVDQLASHGVTFERYDNMPAPQDEKGILRGKAIHQGPDIAWFKDPAGNILSVLQS